MIELCKEAELMRKEIYNHMLKTRGDKYRWFLRALRTFKYFSMSPARGAFLESYYSLMRYVDDVVDGDACLPTGVRNSEEFVLQKIDFAKRQQNPQDKVDYLMLYCFETAQRFGADFSAETQDILNSMLFDARRRGNGKRVIFPEAELNQHFHLLDVRGTIKASLKIFGEDSSKYPFLQPMGFASRTYYNLRDLKEDIRAGLINISAEDCKKDGIRISDLENMSSKPIQMWKRGQAEKGIALIEEHRKSIGEGDFGLLVKLTLPVVYELPARKYFERVLRQT